MSAWVSTSTLKLQQHYRTNINYRSLFPRRFCRCFSLALTLATGIFHACDAADVLRARGQPAAGAEPPTAAAAAGRHVAVACQAAAASAAEAAARAEGTGGGAVFC